MASAAEKAQTTAAQAEAEAAAEHVRNAPVRTRKGRRSMAERLGVKELALKPGEHSEDLMLVVNATEQVQQITDDIGRRCILEPAGYTAKAIREALKYKDPKRVKAKGSAFGGGTMVLVRRRAMDLEARGIVRVLEVVDKADPNDYEME